MKKIICIAAASFLTVASFAQQGNSNQPGNNEVLYLKEVSHDFGQIQQSKPVTYEFAVLNNSTKDTLKISNVQASCGCTTPKWDREPVAPGKSTIITVGYNAAAEGSFSKSVTIMYNGNMSKSITIKGEVIKGLTSSAPLNSSVNLLK